MKKYLNIESVPLILIAGISASFLVSLFALEVFISVLFLYWLYDIKLNFKGRISKLVIIILLFGISRLVSVFFSPYPSLGYEQLLREVLFYLALIPLFDYIRGFDNAKFRIVVNWFLYTGVIVSVYAFITFNLGIFPRAQSITSGYTTYSLYSLVIVLILLFFGPLENSNKHKYLWAFSITIIIVGIILSMGRVSIALIFVLGFVSLFFIKPEIKFVILIVLLTSALCFLSFRTNTKVFSERASNPVYVSDRDIIFKGFLQISSQRPILGFGGGTFLEIFPFKEQFSDKGVGGWHNDFVQIYVEGGIVGLGIYLFLIVSLFMKSIFVLRKNIDKQTRNLTLGLLFALTGMLGSSLTGGFITTPELSIMFLVMSAIIERFELQSL